MPRTAAVPSSLESAQPSIGAIRSRFPALGSPLALLENAGGSQVPGAVAEAIRAYMLNTYVQLGAGYELSRLATETVSRAHGFMNELFNGTDSGHAILGPSTTQLLAMLASCWRPLVRPGDEIVLAETAHEANVGPWLRLADAGATIRWWRVDRDAMDCTLEGLDAVLTDRTRIVAFPHVSNLLGAVAPIEAIVRRAHAAGARVVVDGVAFAPHRALDVALWDVDWYVYSTYKVYGPHMAALYGRRDAVAELTGPNHFFIPKDEVPYKFELGGASHEGCAGLLALAGYLRFLAGLEGEGDADRATIERAFAVMASRELPLQQALLEGLAGLPDVRVIGPTTGGPERVATVSFVHARRASSAIARAAHRANVAIRNGHMYAYRLCEALGIDRQEGVVRISAVHYNTDEEIERALKAVG